MSLFIASLNSGSNGNCYYVGNAHEAILVDAGLSCRETGKRMKRLGLSMQKVKAIFISHEHTDHIRGIEAIIKNFSIPVYITPATLRNSRLRPDAAFIRSLSPDGQVTIGGLTISAFTKAHDAIDPCSFLVTGNGVTIGVITDIGTVCSRVIAHFSRCHAAFLEANYDEDMLEQGSYPTHLKNRIRGGNGHISNRQALELFAAHRPPFMTHLLLAHLSKNNNTPELVSELFSPYARQVEIVVASRYKESAVYEVLPGAGIGQPKNRRAVQATLF